MKFCEKLNFFSCCFEGPGCSSLGVGAFSENGPFRPKGEALVRNQFSWNTGLYFHQSILVYTNFVLRLNMFLVFIKTRLLKFNVYKFCPILVPILIFFYKKVLHGLVYLSLFTRINACEIVRKNLWKQLMTYP